MDTGVPDEIVKGSVDVAETDGLLVSLTVTWPLLAPAGTVKVTPTLPFPSVEAPESTSDEGIGDPMVTVSGEFASYPVPKTVTAVPTGPLVGLGMLTMR